MLITHPSLWDNVSRQQLQTIIRATTINDNAVDNSKIVDNWLHVIDRLKLSFPPSVSITVTSMNHVITYNILL